MRAKVIKKPEGLENYFGKVGTVIWRQEEIVFKPKRKVLLTAMLEFGDGKMQVFDEDDLRMGVKASG